MNSKGFTTTATKAPRPPSNKIERVSNNLENALKSQSGQYKEVDEFLFNLNLSKYVDTFIENGIEDLDTILELNEVHLE